MPRYGPIWVEIAQQQYDALSDDVRLLVDHRVAQLLGDPIADAVYNRRSDQWSIPLGDDGFLFYAVVHDPPRVIVLRLVTGLS
ncbi:MAG: hypothetical protein ACRDSZ_23545 [Pseudonocardiaceae bacterium]